MIRIARVVWYGDSIMLASTEILESSLHRGVSPVPCNHLLQS